jgi:hypothetical protein
VPASASKDEQGWSTTNEGEHKRACASQNRPGPARTNKHLSPHAALSRSSDRFATRSRVGEEVEENTRRGGARRDEAGRGEGGGETRRGETAMCHRRLSPLVII